MIIARPVGEIILYRFFLMENGVNDGDRTRDRWNHNPVLLPAELRSPLKNQHARQDSNLLPSASYHYSFRYQKRQSPFSRGHTLVCGLDHVLTFSGLVRMASTEPLTLCHR